MRMRVCVYVCEGMGRKINISIKYFLSRGSKKKAGIA